MFSFHLRLGAVVATSVPVTEGRRFGSPPEKRDALKTICFQFTTFVRDISNTLRFKSEYQNVESKYRKTSRKCRIQLTSADSPADKG
jgi:hypothetical protein